MLPHQIKKREKKGQNDKMVPLIYQQDKMGDFREDYV